MHLSVRLHSKHTHFHKCVDDQALLAGFAICYSISGRHAGLRIFQLFDSATKYSIVQKDTEIVFESGSSARRELQRSLSATWELLNLRHNCATH